MNWLFLEAETYSEPSQITKIERFVKIVDGSEPLTIFAKRSILEVWQGSGQAYEKNLSTGTCSKLTIEGVNFEYISHLVLVFLLLTLNMQLPTGLMEHCNISLK